MSEYSYNYSGEGMDADPVHFLDHCLPFSFEIQRLQPLKTPPQAAATNYLELEMQEEEKEEGGRGRGLLQIGKESKEDYLSARRGRGAQTMQLHPNFKTMTRRHLRDLIYLKLLNEKQRLNCLAFLRSSPSFAAIRALLSPHQDTAFLRGSLLALFSNTASVRQILNSQANLPQKLLMLKFLERLRQALGTTDINKKWKAL